MDEKLKEEISEAFLAFRSIHSNPKSRADEFSSQILALIKQAGYVRLADDQILPEKILPYPYTKGEKHAQQDMIAAGWRKVNLSKE